MSALADAAVLIGNLAAMIGLRSRLILPLLGSLVFQVVVLRFLGKEIEVPMGRVGVPTFMVWCLPASLAVGLIVESHTESWDWINRSRVIALELMGAMVMALVSLELFWLYQGSPPASHVVAVWALLVAIGTGCRRAVGRSAWLVVFVAVLVLFYGLATPGSMLLSALAESDIQVTLLSLLAIVAARASRLYPRPVATGDQDEHMGVIERNDWVTTDPVTDKEQWWA